MELIAGQLNNRMLQSLNLLHTPLCSEVKAAVAYANHDCMELFNKCVEHGKKLSFFGRYDQSIPVSPGVISWFLDRRHLDVQCRLVSDFYHPKVIWWVGRGVYIGSANLSSRAWTQNIEIGTFICHDEMQASGIEIQLGNLFLEIEARAHDINPLFLEHLKALAKLGKFADDAAESLRQKFSQMRFFPVGHGLAVGEKQSPKDKALEKFQRAWVDSLEKLWYVEKEVTADENRPYWMPASTPKGVQLDQFLFAYHYFFTKQTNANVNLAHEQNKNRKEAALKDAMAWWKTSDFKTSEMQDTVNEIAPRLEELLSRERLMNLSLDEFCEMLSMVHAVGEAVARRSNSVLGLPLNQPHEMAVKHRRNGEILWEKRSSAGHDCRKMLYQLIWGSEKNIATRLWEASRSDEWALPWLREATLGEILGWARPNEFPPRNGRSIKALKALGYSFEKIDGDEDDNVEDVDALDEIVQK